VSLKFNKNVFAPLYKVLALTRLAWNSPAKDTPNRWVTIGKYASLPLGAGLQGPVYPKARKTYTRADPNAEN
jgi:hypothetical protein